MSNLKQVIRNVEISAGQQLKLDLDHKVIRGTEIRIDGILLSTDPRFYIATLHFAVITIPNAHDIHTPLHFNPRFSSSNDHGSGREDNNIVINSKLNDIWTEESIVYPQPFPFGTGKKFDIKIKCEEKHYRISVNENVISLYEYRLPINMINQILIRGQLKLNLLEIIY